MNERIKELMTQSGMISESSIPGMVVTTNMSLKTAEKLAELIVQECVNVLHDNELWNRHISHALKEHFGVEL